MALVNDWKIQLNMTKLDLAVAFLTGNPINPIEHGYLSFRTDDIEAFKRHLRVKGIPLSYYGAWAMGGWEQIFFHDPEGNVVEVHQDRTSEPG